MGLYDRDYMRKPPPDYEPDEGRPRSRARGSNPREEKVNRKITIIFGSIVIGAILLTIIALALSK